MPNVPNQYHIQGKGISVSYYPDGFGPSIEDRGHLIFVYQDAHRSSRFTAIRCGPSRWTTWD